MRRRDFLKEIGGSAVLLAMARAEQVLPPEEPVVAMFEGTVVLGNPTERSITLNVLASDPLEAFVEYGTHSGVYPEQTLPAPLEPAVPIEYTVMELQPDTRYYYRMRFRKPSEQAFKAGPVWTFHTQRAPGSTFSFGVQGDSHPERHNNAFDQMLYERSLRSALSDQPDFYIMMGDDFSVDTIKPDVINADLVTDRYLLQRPYLGQLAPCTPLYLVNGNHEQAARYLLDGTPDNVAVWAQTARNRYYPQPAPDDFYTGNTEVVEFIGSLRNYFAWTWGDALFVTVDPYWSSPVPVDNVYGGGPKASDKWAITLGQTQYQWLKQTLEQSTARWKFVFAHHVNGGTGRGGVELAGLYEWGGHNNKGVWEFDTKRPGWDLPIHQLMVQYGVTIFFQGHDHVFARQELDGVTYVTTPYPADPNYAGKNVERFTSGDVLPGSGYLRVTVSDTSVQIDYVRSFLPGDENDTQVHGQVAYTYTITVPDDREEDLI